MTNVYNKEDWPDYRFDNDALVMHRMHRIGYSAMPSFHLHDYYEIFYLVKGERVYFIDDRVYTARQGDLVVINPHVLHRTTSSSELEEYERILISFKAEFTDSMVWVAGEELLPFVQGSCLIRFPLEKHQEIESIIWDMLTECKEQRIGFKTNLKADLARLLVRIRRQALLNGDEPPSFAHPMHEKVSEIAAFLSRNYAEEITLKQVAEQFYISPYYLSRIFKKLTGFHFKEYIMAVRIKEAQKRLRETQDKIILIAEQVGFRHVAHFNTAFKKMAGVTPLKYRKNRLSLSEPHLSHQGDSPDSLNRLDVDRPPSSS